MAILYDILQALTDIVRRNKIRKSTKMAQGAEGKTLFSILKNWRVGLVLFLLLCSLFNRLESIILPETWCHPFRDIFVQLTCSMFLVIVLWTVLTVIRVVSITPYLLGIFFVLLFIVSRWIHGPFASFKDGFCTFAKSIGKIGFFYLICGSFSFWFFICCKIPGLTLVLGAVCIIILLKIAQRPKIYFFVFAVAGPFLFLVVNGFSYQAGESVEAERIFDKACYDVQCDAQNFCMVSVFGKNSANIRINNQWQHVPGTYRTQRMAYNPNSGHTFIANYIKPDSFGDVAEYFEGRSIRHDLPGCSWVIDLSGDWKQSRLFVACEKEPQVIMYDYEKKEPLRIWKFKYAPYALEYFPGLNKLFVSTEFWGGKVCRISPNDEKIELCRIFSMHLWDIAVDQISSTIFVSNPISGDVLVLDENLKIQKRINAGWAPRDLAIDQEKGLLLIGNYFSNTITLVDLETQTIVKTIVPKTADQNKSEVFKRLRGVHVDLSGNWYSCDSKGVNQFQMPPR